MVDSLRRLYFGGRTFTQSVIYESGNCDWIEESVCRRMGDGRDTVFWFTDRCGHGVLKDKFPRLFNLSNQQQAHVSDVGGWNAIVWQGMGCV